MEGNGGHALTTNTPGGILSLHPTRHCFCQLADEGGGGARWGGPAGSAPG